MLDHLHRWLNDLPVLDPIECQQAPLVQAILISLLCGNFLGIPIVLAVSEATGNDLPIAANLIFFLVILSALVLLRHGYFRLSIMIVSLGGILVLKIFLLPTGLYNDWVLIAFTLPVTLTGLLLGRRSLMLTTALSISVVISLAVVEYPSSHLTESTAPQPDFSGIIVGAFIIVIGLLSLFVDQFGRRWRDALRVSARREQELEGIRQRLEQEISEHRQTEAGLRNSEALYRALYNLIPAMLHSIDAEGRLIQVSDHWLDTTGYERHEVLGRDLTDFLTEASQRYAKEVTISKFLKTGHCQNTSYQLVKKNGEVIDVLLSSIGERDQAGNLMRALAVSIDVTEQKRAEEALRASEARNRAMLDALPDLMFRLAKDGTNLDYYASDPNQLLVPPQVFLGKKIEEVLPVKVADKFHYYIQEALNTGQTQIFEYQLHFPDRGEQYYETRMVVCAEDEVLVIERNITELKQTMEALKQREREYRSLAENLPDIVARLDRDLRHVYVNRRIEPVTGLWPKDFLGKTNRELNMPENLVNDWDEALHVVFDTGWPRTIEFSFSGSGSHEFFEARLIPEFGSEGSVETVLAINRNVTEQEQARQEQERLITELEAKNAELERFTYTVSHDLKSPLITIIGFLSHLEKDVLQEDIERIEEDITYIRDAAQKMGQLLDDLLELSRLGRLVNPPQAISLEALAREAVALVAGQLIKRRVNVDISANLPVVYGDRARLLEVFQNLIDNAIKFMGDQPEPRIEIDLRQEDGKIIYFVRDNGVGIEPRYQQKIFDLFERLSHEGQGTGIGLALVKRIVKLHGGQIWVESAGPGQGSTFYFTLSNEGEGPENG